MPASDVTALITTYNRAHYLVEALDSVLGQTVPPAQVIVVNDGSTDGTVDLLRRYGDRIEVIDQKNGGKPHALNRAMPLVRGAYVWIFDDDDIALPENLERHLAVLQVDPEIGFAYSGCSVIRTHPDGRIEDLGRLQTQPAADDEIFPRMLEQNFLQQQAMLVRTRCYREIGPFDADAGLDHSDDYEMNLRLARRFPGRRLDAVSFLFREHDGDRGRPGASYAASQRSSRWLSFSRRHLPHLQADLTRGEYLPRGLGVEPLDAPRRRRALLQRACIMARCGLWREALADYQEGLVGVMRGVPLDVIEQDLCRRAVGPYLRRELAIQGLVDDRRTSNTFATVLRQSGKGEARDIFAAALSHYARESPAPGKTPVRAGRALALARRIAGVRN